MLCVRGCVAVSAGCVTVGGGLRCYVCGAALLCVLDCVSVFAGRVSVCAGCVAVGGGCVSVWADCVAVGAGCVAVCAGCITVDVGLRLIRRGDASYRYAIACERRGLHATAHLTLAAGTLSVRVAEVAQTACRIGAVICAGAAKYNRQFHLFRCIWNGSSSCKAQY